jgi:hypothetical protein
VVINNTLLAFYFPKLSPWEEEKCVWPLPLFFFPPLSNYRPVLEKEAENRKMSGRSVSEGKDKDDVIIPQLPSIMLINLPACPAILSSFPPFTKPAALNKGQVCP